jgi:protein-L-isoaspartate(D-aspartate) O-methyltransferase
LDFQVARAAMIDSQVRPNDVTDRRLIAAMASMPREAFAPATKAAVAYADVAVETGPGRWMMAPRDFAKLANSAAVKDTDRVLDIAPGTGYSTAILSKLAANVVALETEEAMAKTLGETLAKAGAANVETIFGPLKAGAPSRGPFDVIFVNGAVEEVPKTSWLREEGWRLLCRKVWSAAPGSTHGLEARRPGARPSNPPRRACRVLNAPWNFGSSYFRFAAESGCPRRRAAAPCG